MFFDALHGLDKGVIPFTLRASMTMCIAFEEAIGRKGVTERRIEQRMHRMAGTWSGPVPGQLFHEKFALLFPLSKHCQRTFMHIHRHKGETHSTVWGCDMQLLLLITPFLLYNFFQEEVEDWNQKHSLDPKIDPTSLIIPVVTELLDFYVLLRLKGKDMVEIPEMDHKAHNFLDMTRETFKDFTVGSAANGNKKHICSSEKMHRLVHCAVQATNLGDLINMVESRLGTQNLKAASESTLGHFHIRSFEILTTRIRYSCFQRGQIVQHSILIQIMCGTGSACWYSPSLCVVMAMLDTG